MKVLLRFEEQEIDLHMQFPKLWECTRWVILRSEYVFMEFLYFLWLPFCLFVVLQDWKGNDWWTWSHVLRQVSSGFVCRLAALRLQFSFFLFVCSSLLRAVNHSSKVFGQFFFHLVLSWATFLCTGTLSLMMNLAVRSSCPSTHLVSFSVYQHSYTHHWHWMRMSGECMLLC